MGHERATPRLEPYTEGLVKVNPFTAKADVTGTLVAVLSVTIEDRGLVLEGYRSRAVDAGSVHELVLTDEAGARPGVRVNRAAYLGFARFDGGVISVGDAFYMRGNRLGHVVGFDATHAPNHYNVVVRGHALRNGREWSLGVGDRVLFRFVGEHGGGGGP